MKKIAKYPALILCFFFVVFYFGFDYVFNIENYFFKATLSTILAFILSPKRKKIQTQSGVKTQITWVFLKESIIID